ncbi:MAG: endo alpha-1,4 polygalactosaminidase [Firmicutes bacterium]|nr:endo alpha-1,4 polygalactosaminidase [Bacillota bacterium]
MRAILKDVKNYVLYYGPGREDELSIFDLVIVESGWHNKDSLKRIKQRNSLILAYMSALEVIPGSALEKRASACDYLRINGKNAINEEYGNFIMDPRSSNWRKIITEDANKLVREGYDGIFLDTLGIVEDKRLSGALSQELLLSTAHLVGRIRRHLPDAIIVQNSGMGNLYELTARTVNGFCWENPSLPFSTWSYNKAGVLKEIQDKYGTRIMILLQSEEPPDVALKNFQSVYSLASQCNFLVYISPGDYTSGIFPMLPNF